MLNRRLLAQAAGAALALLALLIWLLWPQAVAVETAVVDHGPLIVTADEIAETRSRDRYVVTAPVTGRLQRLELREGDPVKLGQLLARIEPAPIDERERAAREAQLASARALQREAEQHAMHVEQDLALARRERERLESLAARGLVATQQVDQARVSEATASNDASAARFRLQAAAAGVAQARAGLLNGESATGARSVIPLRAPVASFVLRIPDRSERLVSAGSTLMILGDTANLEVLVELLSTEAVKVRPGMPAFLDGWGGEEPLQARVSVVEPFAFTKISALGIEEKRVNVLLSLAERPAALGDGYRLTAHIITWQTPRTLRVAAGALFRCGEHWCAYRLQAGRARRQIVDVAQRNQDHAEVRSGLAAGDVVVLYPGTEVRDGVRVRPGAQ